MDTPTGLDDIEVSEVPGDPTSDPSIHKARVADASRVIRHVHADALERLGQ